MGKKTRQFFGLWGLFYFGSQIGANRREAEAAAKHQAKINDLARRVEPFYSPASPYWEEYQARVAVREARATAREARERAAAEAVVTEKSANL